MFGVSDGYCISVAENFERERRAIPVFFLLAVAITLAAVILGSHAAKHGEQIQRVRSAFDVSGDRICKHGSGAEFYSLELDTWMYLCFYGKNEFDKWVLTDKITNPFAREITAIPREHMRNAIRYLTNVIRKRGYQLVKSDPGFPEFWR